MTHSFLNSTSHGTFGFALSGGGARGFAHVGALKALSECGIKPSVIAGVSAGSVIACMYAAGLSSDDMMRAFADKSFNDLAELSVPKDGFFRMTKFIRFLRKSIPYANIEDLPIPTLVCATDLNTCSPKVFDSGPIAERIAASCSIPIVFSPIKIDGNYYVDGGVLHNLPSAVIRNHCDTLIGINVSPFVHEEKFKPSILEIAHRSYKMISRSNMDADKALCNIVVEMDSIAHHKVFGIKAMWEIAEKGYNETIKILKQNNLYTYNGND
ncbi:MAG: patatin-like phospholipase family protein [Muribaculaceae bacterium]